MKNTGNQGKLSLNKKFIANLNKEQLNMIKGGMDGIDDVDAEVAGGENAARTWTLSRCMFSDHPTCKDHHCCKL